MNVSALEIRIPSFASFVYSMFWKLSLNDVTKVTHFSPRVVTALPSHCAPPSEMPHRHVWSLFKPVEGPTR